MDAIFCTVYTAYSDYIGGTFDVIILAGMTNATLSVVTNVGTFPEDNEFFKAILSLPEGTDNVVIGVDTAFIQIMDTVGERLMSWPAGYYFCIYTIHRIYNCLLSILPNVVIFCSESTVDLGVIIYQHQFSALFSQLDFLLTIESQLDRWCCMLDLSLFLFWKIAFIFRIRLLFAGLYYCCKRVYLHW